MARRNLSRLVRVLDNQSSRLKVPDRTQIIIAQVAKKPVVFDNFDGAATGTNQIDNRMPAILRRDDEARWLDMADNDRDDVPFLLQMLRPFVDFIGAEILMRT